MSVTFCNESEEEYLPKLFNSNPSLIGEKVAYDEISFSLPNNLKRVSKDQLKEVKSKTSNLDHNFYNMTLIDVFEGKDEVYGFSVSKISENDLSFFKNDDYLKMLVNSFKTENIFRLNFLLNDIKAVQFQINHSKLIELKLFLSSDNRIFLLDFIVARDIFYDRIHHIESVLSTISIN